MNYQFDESQEQLLEMIGRDLLGSSGMSIDRKHLIAIGEKWIEKQWSHLQEVVCTSKITQHLLKNTDEVILVGAIADIISGICIGVTPSTVATLITRIGLKNFCNLSK